MGKSGSLLKEMAFEWWAEGEKEPALQELGKESTFSSAKALGLQTLEL